jgi:hypothetical protein
MIDIDFQCMILQIYAVSITIRMVVSMQVINLSLVHNCLILSLAQYPTCSVMSFTCSFFYSFSQHNGAMSSMTDFCDAFYMLSER